MTIATTTSASPVAASCDPRGLGRLGLRLRAVGAMRGLGKSALILAALAAVAMAADVAFALPPSARWTIWATWIATAAIGLVAGVIRPLVRRLAWNDLAALAERGEPSLGERLTTAVGLLRQEPHGSPELIAAVVDDAAVPIRTGRPHPRRLDARGPGVAHGWGDSRRTGRSRRRSCNPIRSRSSANASFSPGLTSIGSAGSWSRWRRETRSWQLGSDVSAVGHRALSIWRGRAARRWPGSNGPAPMASHTACRWRPTPTRQQGKQAFTVTLPRLTSSLTYRALSVAMPAGGIRSRWSIGRRSRTLKAHVEPPAYTGDPGPRRATRLGSTPGKTAR